MTIAAVILGATDTVMNALILWLIYRWTQRSKKDAV
jgi:hypothetical protein